MTKQEFLDKIKKDLSSLSDGEIQSALKYYEEYFGKTGEQEDIKIDFEVCKSCGAKNDEEAVFCLECGKAIKYKPCKQCGEPNKHEALFCTNCGNGFGENTNIPVRPKSKSRWISLLLCLSLGFFGAHRFYEKKFASAVIYLLTFGLCGFGVIVDLLILVFKKESEKSSPLIKFLIIILLPWNIFLFFAIFTELFS